MKHFLLTTGLILSFAINLIPMQVQSVPVFAHVASQPVEVVPKPTSVASEKEVIHHGVFPEDIRPNVSSTVSPRRRVVAKAAANDQLIFENPMVAAIDQSDATMKHKELFNEVLYALPAKCRNTLQHLYVKYQKQEHRGLAGKSIMILDGTVKSENELRALFVHESGHNWDLGCLTGSADAGKSTFSDGDEAIYKNDPSLEFYKISWLTSGVQRSNAQPEDFVSGYASYDIFEDFSESFAYFVLHNAEFAKRAQTNAALASKYIYIRDTLFNGTVPKVATSASVFSGKVPWDITKLNYQWQPNNG